MKRFLLAAAATALLGTSAAFAQVVVRVGPPAPIIERRPIAPAPGYVWVGGYHRWDGGRYVWVSGHWMMPPRPGGVWIAGHWRHAPGGWVWVEGHWRYR